MVGNCLSMHNNVSNVFIENKLIATKENINEHKAKTKKQTGINN